MEYKEFNTRAEAQKAIDELNQKNGVPIPGNVTQTMTVIEEIDGLFYIDKSHINKTIDESKAKDVKIIIKDGVKVKDKTKP